MADETRTPQKDPPEGSRKVIEHELERQSGQAGGGKSGSGASEAEGGAERKRGKDLTESRH